MVLLSLCIALSWARDERMGVVVLPARVEGTTPAQGAELVKALQSELPGVEGFREIDLSGQAQLVLQDDPRCREQPDCLLSLLPAGAELVIDPRLQRVDGQTSVDLRLLRKGELSKRVAAPLPAGGVDELVEAELPLLLRGWARDERLYLLATQGNDSAAQQLRERFPESPYTRALDRGE